MVFCPSSGYLPFNLYSNVFDRARFDNLVGDAGADVVVSHGLKATHPYSSPWWSWPFLIRPIYLYTSDEISGWVARIYAFGNPLVFWFGFVSVVYVLFTPTLRGIKSWVLLYFPILSFLFPGRFLRELCFCTTIFPQFLFWQ